MTPVTTRKITGRSLEEDNDDQMVVQRFGLTLGRKPGEQASCLLAKDKPDHRSMGRDVCTKNPS
jgi:hypothetical protein